MKRIIIKLLFRKYKEIIKSFFELIGLFISIYELLNAFLPNLIKKIPFNIMSLFLLVIIILIVSIIKNYPKLKRCFYINNRDINITIVVGDIFKQKGSIVIPTNTTFDTCMENEFISVKSIQGQFQHKYFLGNLIELDRYISKSLKDVACYEKLDDGRKTKTKKYNLGTVAKIIHNNNKYYFLAISDVNKYGSSSGNFNNIITSLYGLWSFLGEHKHVEPLVIPVIGTGRAGIAEATRMNVIKEIVFSFVAMSTEEKITNNLIICIYPDDINNNLIDINELYEYVYYVANYEYDKLNTKNDGILLS